MKEEKKFRKTGSDVGIALESKEGLKRFSHLLSHDVTVLEMAGSQSFFKEYPDAYEMINSLQDGEVIGVGSLDELRLAYLAKTDMQRFHTNTTLKQCYPTPLDHPRVFSCGSTEMGSGDGLNEAPAKIFDSEDEAIFLGRWEENKSYAIYVYLVGDHKQKDFANDLSTWLKTAETAAEIDEFAQSIQES